MTADDILESRKLAMETKLIEIRDEGTHIPALAITITRKDGYPAARAGFGDQQYILLIDLNSDECHYDSTRWRWRTMQVAHKHLEDHWAEIKNEDVVDVEFILGITDTKKTSEKFG